MQKLMISKIILVVLGEPNSIFSEVLFKFFKSKISTQNNKKIVLIGNKQLLIKQMKLLKYNFYLNEITEIREALSTKINIINISYKFKSTFGKINSSSNKYIENSFKKAIDLVEKDGLTNIINGPISKTHFLKKKFPGVTEYVASKSSSKDPVMLIYNEKLAVTPLTTHIPIKKVSKYVKKAKIIKNITQVDKFYKSKLKKIPKFAILGLNPHCESTDRISEEKKEIIPAIKKLNRNKIQVSGPFSADTFFLRKNIKRFDVVMGMYHDQVLIPIKTLFKFEAINITIGLPFIRVTPDHGPNHNMIGKNKSDASSIFYAFKFLNKIK